ncbi:apoptosis inhibitor 5 isoform X2 [Pelobates cultripes]|uniref:Apoptosis inhibitor 5 isoform X2 n=1 Tax=Pelobates cultripes TaxID=61616 RepID=A0AAD1WTN4_PELCU|nr:apoptosis inhibitor 5 isoform X2 [Pelobates cultripes]
MASMTELYRNYWILADAKEEDLPKHKLSYKAILDGACGGQKERKIAARLIPKFFKFFPDLSADAFYLHLDLCDDRHISVRHQAIRGLLHFATNENLHNLADVLVQLLKTGDVAEFDLANNALLHILKIDAKGTLKEIIHHICKGKKIVRKRAIKFLSFKLPEEVMTKEAEELILFNYEKILNVVSGEELYLFVKFLSSLHIMQNDKGNQLLVDLMFKEADLHETINYDSLDSAYHLIKCAQQVVPLFSENVHSNKFVTHFCEKIIPILGYLYSLKDGNDVQLEVLKLLAEMSRFYGVNEKVEYCMLTVFDTLLNYLPPPPEDTDGNEDIQLHFSRVECLLFVLQQLGKKLPDFLIMRVHGDKLAGFKIRLQYFAENLQEFIQPLRLALEENSEEFIKPEEWEIRREVLRMSNIETLIKDLTSFPPSYKSQVTLSWTPEIESEIG